MERLKPSISGSSEEKDPQGEFLISPLPAERLAGIEWMRGVAVFGVICIHSGLAVHNRTTPAAATLRAIFSFAVPFFLVLSFFFAVRAEKEGWLSWSLWMKKRAGRLLIPFVFWSSLYLALHGIKLVAYHQIDQIKALFANPAGLVMSGGTSLALYFLPLLFTGLILIHLFSPLFQRFSSWMLIFAFLMALGAREFCYHAGFDDGMIPTAQGGAWFHLVSDLMEDGLRCCPLIFAAGLLERHLPVPESQNAYPLLGAGFSLLVIAYFIGLPEGLTELLLGIGAFLLAWELSAFMAPGHWAIVVGCFSFGVYLVHQVFLELIEILFPSRGLAGVIESLAITIVVYAFSMLSVGLASRGSGLVRRIFGFR